jgi:hypothetical protein
MDQSVFFNVFHSDNVFCFEGPMAASSLNCTPLPCPCLSGTQDWIKTDKGLAKELRLKLDAAVGPAKQNVDEMISYPKLLSSRRLISTIQG